MAICISLSAVMMVMCCIRLWIGYFNLFLLILQKADRKFATSLVCLINNIRKFTKTTKDLSESANFAELVAGYFEGIKVIIFLSFAFLHYSTISDTSYGVNNF